MTILLSLFGGILIVSFVVVWLIAKPAKHKAIARHRLLHIYAPARRSHSTEKQHLLKPVRPSRFTGLDRLLEGTAVARTLNHLIDQADANTSAGNVLVNCVGSAMAAFLGAHLFLSNSSSAAIPGALAGVIPYVFLRIKRARRFKAFENALPDALDMLARSLRASHSLNSAIEVLAEQALEPVASEFRIVSQQQRFGIPFRECLLEMVTRVSSQDLRFVVTAILVQKETGGNLIHILERTTQVIRERQRIYGEIRTKTAQGRLTGWVLAMLPIILGLIINVLNPGYAGPLIHDPLGQKALLVGAVLITIGTLFIRKITSIQV
jgi:tight adherence protein B